MFAYDINIGNVTTKEIIQYHGTVKCKTFHLKKLKLKFGLISLLECSEVIKSIINKMSVVSCELCLCDLDSGKQ
jgi:hypothetical protein